MDVLPLDRGPALAMPKPPSEAGDDQEPYAEVLKTFGKALKQARLARSLTQEQLAAKADLKRPYIFQLERGDANVTLRTLAKMADVLDLHVHDLLPKEADPLASVSLLERLIPLYKRMVATLSDRHAQDGDLLREAVDLGRLLGPIDQPVSPHAQGETALEAAPEHSPGRHDS